MRLDADIIEHGVDKPVFAVCLEPDIIRPLEIKVLDGRGRGIRIIGWIADRVVGDITFIGRVTRINIGKQIMLTSLPKTST